ncbi:hypothetical protein V6N11_031772 [Hibiscus sabdariffa]|uniref:Uncharacterized protein n=1 Tax=Hibiscus sabdariffa TaxID=183260 RepID=A0ABR2SYM6_9ROSI
MAPVSPRGFCRTFVGGQTSRRPMVLPPEFWSFEKKQDFLKGYKVKGDAAEERELERPSASTGATVSPFPSPSAETFC